MRIINQIEFTKNLKYIIQRVSFHNALFSRIISEFKYNHTKSGSERERIMLDSLRSFVGCEASLDWKKDSRVIKDILYARAYFAIDSKEFFLYDFPHRNNKEKKNYVGWHELDYYYSCLNKTGYPEIFESKEKTYDYFSPFYGRKIEYIASENDKELFISFVQKHPNFIIKPTDQFGGAGIRILREKNQTQPETIWEEIKDQFPFVVEELIQQASDMNIFYPHAVNTIRYNSFYYKGKLKRLQAVFRIGRGGSVVDNATSGGIYALVDTETGRILGPARSFKNELFEKHPDTGMKFEGNYIPRWDELNALLDQVVRIVPEQKQVGWDFALSTNGWVMVEANTTPVLQDFDLDHGLRELLKKTFGKCIYIWR